MLRPRLVGVQHTLAQERQGTEDIRKRLGPEREPPGVDVDMVAVVHRKVYASVVMPVMHENTQLIEELEKRPTIATGVDHMTAIFDLPVVDSSVSLGGSSTNGASPDTV